MDIAEIRKKAKAQGQPEKEQAGAIEDIVTPDEQTYEPQEVVADVSDNVTEREMVEVAAEQLQALDESNDALDRLFAGTDEMVLATDESYADLLEEKSDEQAIEISQYLAFHLGDEEYALDIKKISEIIKVREFTDIPRAPEYVLGIISLRGVVVPVFDLRQRLNLGNSELLATSRIVVCQQEDVIVGLLVDTINQVVNLVEAEIEPPPGVLSGLDREMIFGIGRYQGRMIILLQIENVLSVEMS
jgi:purine-binding chemotaxis protein CheW